MDIIQNLRRIGILGRKRFSLFKYNVKHKFQRGEGYDFEKDEHMLLGQLRSLNLLDFTTSAERELYLIDIYSDQTIYGGLSETSLQTVRENDDNFRKFSYALMNCIQSGLNRNSKLIQLDSCRLNICSVGLVALIYYKGNLSIIMG